MIVETKVIFLKEFGIVSTNVLVTRDHFLKDVPVVIHLQPGSNRVGEFCGRSSFLPKEKEAVRIVLWKTKVMVQKGPYFSYPNLPTTGGFSFSLIDKWVNICRINIGTSWLED